MPRKKRVRKKRDYTKFKRKAKIIGKRIGKASLITAKAVYVGTKVGLREEHKQSQRYAKDWSKQLFGTGYMPQPQKKSRGRKKKEKRERDFIWA